MTGWFEKTRASVVFKIVRSSVLLGLAFVGLGVFVAQPSCTRLPPSSKRQIPAERLHRHVSMLAERFSPRSCEDHVNLSHCAAYIASQFRNAGGRVEMQEYEVRNRIYRNVVVSFGPVSAPRIVVGAHYDTFGATPGADDNASGVAGLIELAYLLGDNAALGKRVDLVAFTLEEPPYFRTDDMGSARYARALHERNVDVEAMVCLEMIGYFSDEKKSQEFPTALLGLLYPDTGNYIAVIGSPGDRKLIKQVKVSMRGASDLPVYSMCVPKSFPGVDYSDHLSFWEQGCTAVLVTDTAFYRNTAYHAAMDIPTRLDYDRMANVVLGVYEAVVRLAD